MQTGAFELTFLGTRGEIAIRSRRHRRHSALLIKHKNNRIMIDCGADWLGQLSAIAPTAIVLTHAHADHACGLAEGAPCPVYGTEQTFALLRRYRIDDRRAIPARRPVLIGAMRFTAYPVRHSLRAPAVGYRVAAGRSSFFYLPDVAELPDVSTALRGIAVYIGDGATITRSMVRRKHGTLIGHASVAAQLDWCRRARIRQAVFTHCGSQIVRGDARRLNALIRRLGQERDVEARLACDGDQLVFPCSQDG